MKTLPVLYHIAKADFLERIRRYSFLLTLVGALYLGYSVVVGHFKMMLGAYRGINNSAWVGFQMALTAALVLSLGGFYVVKNTVERDLQTRVGEILATTPIDKLDYLAGKALSNFAALSVMTAVLAVAAVAGQFWSGEDLHVRLWPLLSPFLLFVLPVVAFIAALAVLFETISWLRGGAGNILYFFVWMTLLVFAAEKHSGFTDFMGFDLVQSHLESGLYAKLPDYNGGFSLGVLGGRHALKTFLWEGFRWHAGLVWMRLYWFAVAGTLLLLACLFFDRFRSAGGPWRERSLIARVLRLFWPRPKAEHREERLATSTAPRVLGATARLTPLAAAPSSHNAGRLFLAELRLMLKGQRWWWYTVAAGLLIFSLTASELNARRIFLPLAWLWPVLLWSSMGTREARHQTEQLVFSLAHPLRRQVPATWLAGVFVSLLMGSGIAWRMLWTGDTISLLGWLTAACFIPSLALALGVWSGSSKLFEVVYILWWYAGPMSHAPGLDFMFTSPQSLSAGSLRTYLAAILVLLALAFLGRKRALQV